MKEHTPRWEFIMVVVAFVVLEATSFTPGFAITNRGFTTRVSDYGLSPSSPWHQKPSSTSSRLQMALTPVGPFCPFRSKSTMDMEPRMEELQSSNVGDFGTEMQRIQLDMQMGQTPDPERLNKVADGIEQSVEVWEALITRLKLSPDFQTREYAKLTQAHLSTHDVTVESIASMMKWQAGCMRAMASNQPPPMPPPDIDLEKMMKQAMDASSSKKPPPSMNAMQAAESITANPFSPGNLESDTVREEYEALVQDHSSLIEFGSNYADFDPLGKIAYLDQIEKIEERWDGFFFRFKLMGTINQEFKDQCDSFLTSMNLDEDEFRDLLKKGHQLLREEAERERP